MRSTSRLYCNNGDLYTCVKLMSDIEASIRSLPREMVLFFYENKSGTVILNSVTCSPLPVVAACSMLEAGPMSGLPASAVPYFH